MEQSILNSTKKVLQIQPSYTAFDADILMHINTAFTTLHQLGVGPIEGFMIEDELPEWSDFLGTDQTLNSVKTYVYLKVRMLFDPPTSSFAVSSMEEQIKQLEWRLNLHQETRFMSLPIIEETIPMIDGGTV